MTWGVGEASLFNAQELMHVSKVFVGRHDTAHIPPPSQCNDRPLSICVAIAVSGSLAFQCLTCCVVHVYMYFGKKNASIIKNRTFYVKWIVRGS